MFITRSNVRVIFRFYHSSHFSDPEIARTIRRLNLCMFKCFFLSRYRLAQARRLKRSAFATSKEFRKALSSLLNAKSRYCGWTSRVHRLLRVEAGKDESL